MMSDWYAHLLRDITKYQSKELDAVPRISEFYTQLLDYIVNPKIHEKNALCIAKGFIDGNMFEALCNKHRGLFDRVKSDIA